MERRTFRERELPELFLGLVALAVAAVIPGVVIASAIRDVKKRRDTITVTASAREPIRADLARWRIAVRAQRGDPAGAARLLRREVVAVRAFFRAGGLGTDEVNEPPVAVGEVTRRIGPRRFVQEFRLTQRFEVTTRDIAKLEGVAGRVGELLEQGLPLTVGSITYVSTQLTEARIKALRSATENARERAEALVEGLGGDLGAVRSAQLGVYQIVPRNSTQISDYGINDTTTRDKDVISVVTVTFAVS
jgi:hypothetical protein